MHHDLLVRLCVVYVVTAGDSERLIERQMRTSGHGSIMALPVVVLRVQCYWYIETNHRKARPKRKGGSIPTPDLFVWT